MIQFLDQLDKDLILALNNSYSVFWNILMSTISGKLVWIPLYLTIIVLTIIHWKKQSWIIIVALLLAILLADQIASGILKNLVQRPRPTHAPDIAHLIATVNGYRGGQYGFVSSHASNSFALATLTALIFRNQLYTIPIFFWAMIVSYSRIYLGVHYVGDILGGILVGVLVAFLIYWVMQKKTKILHKKISYESAGIFTVILLSYFFLIIMYSVITQ